MRGAQLEPIMGVQETYLLISREHATTSAAAVMRIRMPTRNRNGRQGGTSSEAIAFCDFAVRAAGEARRLCRCAKPSRSRSRVRCNAGSGSVCGVGLRPLEEQEKRRQPRAVPRGASKGGAGRRSRLHRRTRAACWRQWPCANPRTNPTSNCRPDPSKGLHTATLAGPCAGVSTVPLPRRASLVTASARWQMRRLLLKRRTRLRRLARNKAVMPTPAQDRERAAAL